MGRYVYHDASVYLLLKNLTGKIKAYKENLYGAHAKNVRCIATKVDPENCAVYELDGKPAQQVYAETIGYKGSNLSGQTLFYPLGRMIGDECYLISLKEPVGKDGFICYKKVNFMDIITIMELKDMKMINEDTIRQIRAAFPKIQGMFSINCIFRHDLFQKEHYEDTYLDMMNAVGSHAGMIGLGEHFNTQHVNQTMSGFAFD